MGSCVTRDSDRVGSEISTNASSPVLPHATLNIVSRSSSFSGEAPRANSVPNLLPLEHTNSTTHNLLEFSEDVSRGAPCIAVQSPSVMHPGGIMSLDLNSSFKTDDDSHLSGNLGAGVSGNQKATNKNKKSEKKQKKKISKPMSFASVLDPTEARPVLNDGEGSFAVWRPGLSPTPSLLALLPSGANNTQNNNSSNNNNNGGRKDRELSLVSNSSPSPKRGGGRKSVTQGKSFNSSIGSAGSPSHRGSRGNVIFSQESPPLEEDPHHAFLAALALQESNNASHGSRDPQSNNSTSGGAVVVPNPLLTGCAITSGLPSVPNSSESSPADTAEWSMCSLPHAGSHHQPPSPSHNSSTAIGASSASRRSRTQPPLADSTLQSSSFTSDFLKDMAQSNVSGGDSQRSHAHLPPAPSRVRASGFPSSNSPAHIGGGLNSQRLRHSMEANSSHRSQGDDLFGEELSSQMYASYSTDTFHSLHSMPVPR